LKGDALKALIQTNNTTLDIYVPEVLRTSKEEWVHQSAAEAEVTALEVAHYFFRLAQHKWGHHLGSREDYQARQRTWDGSASRRYRSSRNVYENEFLCRLVVSPLPRNTVGLARNDNEIALNVRHLNCEENQWSVLTETVPHEVAHVVFNTLYLYSELPDNSRLFGSKRIPHHGKLWKNLFCAMTGFAKVKNRFYNQVVR
jgi:hypothetical protein